MNIRIARIIGHIIGDGQLTETHLKYWNTDKKLLKIWENDIRALFNKSISKNLHKGVWEYSIWRSLAVDKLLRLNKSNSYDWEIPKSISNSNSKIKRTFLRALFDDDATIYAKQKSPQAIKLYSVNLKGLKQVQLILNSLKIKSKIYGPYVNNTNTKFYELRIIRKNEMIRFKKLVGFDSIKKMKLLAKLKGT